MSVARGRFITVEGVEGAGKSTQLAFLREHLETLGHAPLMTREPGGTDLAERVREILLDPRHGDMTPDAELLLVFAARADHLARRVRPALESGRWVVSDRFTDATFAYQGGGRGIPAPRIAVIEDWVQGSLRPDRVILLDLAPEVAAQRVAGRGEPDRFEREALDFFERVRRAYLARADAAPQRYRVVDASGTPDEVRARVETALDGLE
jgi:dTMP kinase